MATQGIMTLGAQLMRRLGLREEYKTDVMATLKRALVPPLTQHLGPNLILVTDATAREKQKRRHETVALVASPDRSVEMLARELMARLVETQQRFELKDVSSVILDVTPGVRDWPTDQSGALYISLLV